MLTVLNFHILIFMHEFLHYFLMLSLKCLQNLHTRVLLNSAICDMQHPFVFDFSSCGIFEPKAVYTRTRSIMVASICFAFLRMDDGLLRLMKKELLR